MSTAEKMSVASCVFFKRNMNIIYCVADMIISTSNEDEIENIDAVLNKTFKLKIGKAEIVFRNGGSMV